VGVWDNIRSDHWTRVEDGTAVRTGAGSCVAAADGAVVSLLKTFLQGSFLFLFRAGPVPHRHLGTGAVTVWARCITLCDRAGPATTLAPQVRR